MKLGDLVRDYRVAHDLSQRQFAQICGVSNGTISNLESGINPNTGKPITPTMELVKKLATAMSMSMTELMTVVDDTPIYIGGEQDEQNDSVTEDTKTHPLVVTGYTGSGKSTMLKKVFDETIRTQATQVRTPVNQQAGTKVIQRTAGQGSDQHIFLSYMSQSREVSADIMQYLQQKLSEQEDKIHNLICIISHDGGFRTRWLTDLQLSALNAILDQMPDAAEERKP